MIRVLTRITVVLMFCFLSQAATARPLHSGLGGCLDIDFGDPVGNTVGGPSYNVILWPDCHGGPNQNWTLTRDGKLRATVNGTSYCLTVSQSQGAGDGFQGGEVHAVAMCNLHTYQNVRRLNGGFRMTGRINTGGAFPVLCLDVNQNAPRSGNGAGLDVFVWPDCHLGPNQQWSYSSE